jgi:L-gulonolactone oxidase
LSAVNPAFFTRRIQAWGRLKAVEAGAASPAFADLAVAALAAAPGSVLPLGAARSYGDVGLTSDGVLIGTASLDRFLAADWEQGVIRAEAGMTLDALLRVAVPRGWFAPVTPGTKFVTLGGAVANDVHGKNHEVAGTFGRHVRRLGLARSSGEVLELSPDDHPALFAATVGGLGLTGLILWVEVQLKPIASAAIEVETVAMRDLDDFFRLAEDSAGWEHTVAWVDCLARGRGLGRGLFMRGRHCPAGTLEVHRAPRRAVPIDAPAGLLNGLTVGLFNAAYRARPWALGRRTQHYDPFFYPLDAISGWNRLYGPHGFYQHQSVVPTQVAPEALKRLLTLTGEHRQGSFLVVLKMFGDVPSPGLLSFPMAGATLALDLPNQGPSTERLLQAMADVAMEAGGRLYPAKDATMSAEAFRRGYPAWPQLEAQRDPKIMSDFWRRVTR